MIERRSRLRRWAKPVLWIFIVATLLFFGAAGYAVWNSAQERGDICGEVQELRDDVVTALDILTEKSQAPDVRKARETIGTPKCK